MKRAYVYKLRPNRSQAAKLAETLETCRLLYNEALFRIIDLAELCKGVDTRDVAYLAYMYHKDEIVELRHKVRNTLLFFEGLVGFLSDLDPEEFEEWKEEKGFDD